MDLEARQIRKWAGCGVLGLALASAAVSAPPPGRGSLASAAGTGGARGGGRLETLAARPADPDRGAADRVSGVKLDLRAPADMPSLDELRAGEGSRGDESHVPSPESAAAPARFTPGESLRVRLEQELPSLGTDRGVRSLSRAQELAQRFRREGLPVARLFETRSALVSLGLNQRGKPGIWLIQKLP